MENWKMSIPLARLWFQLVGEKLEQHTGKQGDSFTTMQCFWKLKRTTKYKLYIAITTSLSLPLKNSFFTVPIVNNSYCCPFTVPY